MQPLRRYEILKIILDHFFSLHENRDGHIAGLIEVKSEELGTICTNRKDVTFLRSTIFVFMKNFLSVQSLRRYEFFKK